MEEGEREILNSISSLLGGGRETAQILVLFFSILDVGGVHWSARSE